MASAGATYLEVTRSPPAARNWTARTPGGTLATAWAAPRSSEMITPPKCDPVAQHRPHHDRREDGQVTRVDPGVGRQRPPSLAARPRRWPRWKSPQVRVVGGGDRVHHVGAEVGVPAAPGRARGSAWRAIATPGLGHPRMNATPCSPLACGSAELPVKRADRRVRGAVAAGTTSITGARLRLTPAARSSLPQVRACARSGLVGQRSLRAALGITSKPGPASAWTSPPSWLAATKNRTPPVTWGEGSDCTARLTAPTPATPAVSVAMQLHRAEVVRPDRAARWRHPARCRPAPRRTAARPAGAASSGPVPGPRMTGTSRGGTGRRGMRRWPGRRWCDCPGWPSPARKEPRRCPRTRPPRRAAGRPARGAPRPAGPGEPRPGSASAQPRSRSARKRSQGRAPGRGLATPRPACAATGDGVRECPFFT